MHIIDTILKKRREVIFISPHLDDVILSCGGLLIDLKLKKIKIKVVTIFTEISPPPYSEFAKIFLHSSGYTNMSKFFQARRLEDKRIFNKLKIDNFNLNFTDAALRKKYKKGIRLKLIGRISPDTVHIYPKGRDIFNGKISVFDLSMLRKIKNDIKKIIKRQENTIVFSPIAIGSHIDHIIVREICKENFRHVVYWGDFPYLLKNKRDERLLKEMKLDSFVWTKNLEVKRRLSLNYKTQIRSLFPSGSIPLKNEIYYFNKEVFEIL